METNRTASTPLTQALAGLGQPAATDSLLGNPVTLALLNLFCSQAVLLDPKGRVLGSSEDVFTALGLACPFPTEGRFPALEELELQAQGFCAFSLAVPMAGGEGHIYVFEDIRARVQQEEVEAGFLQESLDILAKLDKVAGALEALPEVAGAPLGPLRKLVAILRGKWLVQRKTVLSRHRSTAMNGTGRFPAGLALDDSGLPARIATGNEHLFRDGRDTILIVDDSFLVLRLLEFVLSKENCRVLTATNGQDGLALAQECQPDLILLDALMPGMDGFQVCGRLKADPRTSEIPVIFVTALRGEADEVFALEAGAIDFISKPITPAIVVARVRNHLELKRSKDRLRALSLMDGLTGIANRRQFDLCLETEWKRTLRTGRPLSLIMGDVDFFKNYNDHLGHAEGDECLRQVAQVFHGVLRRPGDMAARYGGEEFVCILPDTDAEGAYLVAREILAGMAALDLYHPESRVSSRVTVSLGLATVGPAPADNATELVAEADRNMYQAKHQGRNGIVQAGRPFHR